MKLFLEGTYPILSSVSHFAKSTESETQTSRPSSEIPRPWSTGEKDLPVLLDVDIKIEREIDMERNIGSIWIYLDIIDPCLDVALA